MDTQNHLLVVDDNRDIRELFAEYLTRNGFRVTAVADGVAMRQAQQAGSFALIIPDLMLPRKDGLSLCASLLAGATQRGPDTDADRAPGPK